MPSYMCIHLPTEGREVSCVRFRMEDDQPCANLGNLNRFIGDADGWAKSRRLRLEEVEAAVRDAAALVQVGITSGEYDLYNSVRSCISRTDNHFMHALKALQSAACRKPLMHQSIHHRPTPTPAGQHPRARRVAAPSQWIWRRCWLLPAPSCRPTWCQPQSAFCPACRACLLAR